MHHAVSKIRGYAVIKCISEHNALNDMMSHILQQSRYKSHPDSLEADLDSFWGQAEEKILII